MDVKDLERVIASVLKCHDFKKKGRTWFHHMLECIHVINLQTSPFGGQYYINLGIFVKALGELPFPKENQCHIRIRLENLLERHSGQVNRESLCRYNQSLNLEDKSISLQDRADIIAHAIHAEALPFLALCKSVPSVKELLVHEQFYRNHTAAILKQFLNLPPD